METAKDTGKAIDFASYMLMKIRRAVDADAFLTLVDGGIVLEDLIDNYDYYHMYPPAGVIQLLAEREPLIARYNLVESIR
jgi:hypothetical protein